jgi:hypothetical protein
MSVVIPSLRAAIAVPPWAKNVLWRNARAVPSLDLRFADNKSLVDAVTGASLITFTRASSGTYVGSDGVLRTAAIDVPRFDHNPTTGESLGLLVEEQRTNLLLRSEEFDNASWTKLGATVSANTQTAPNGTTSADSLIETATTGLHVVFQDTTASPLVTQTLSVYAKANQRIRVSLQAAEAGTNNAVAATFNLSTCAVVSQSNSGTGSGASASIVAVGNGWCRCTVTGIPSTTGTAIRSHVYLANDANQINYTGNGTSGLFIWGAQLE